MKRSHNVERRSFLAKAARSLRRATGGAAAAATALAVVCAAQAAEPISVRLDWATHGMHAPFFLAMEKGWFAKAGLEPAIEDGNGSSTTVQLVATGNFDVGHAALAPMALATARGLPITSVAGFIRKGDMGVLVPAGSGLTEPGDLVGKKVVYTAGSLEGPFVEPFFRSNGIDPGDVGLLNVEASSKVGTYLSGNADAAISTVPYFLPIAAGKRDSDGILFADFGMNLPGFGLVANTRALEERPDPVRRFASVIAGAWRYILDGHEDEAIAAILKHRPNAPSSAEVMRSQIEAFRPFFFTEATKDSAIGLQAQADWQDTLRVMEEAKAIPSGTATEAYFTNAFLDHAWFEALAAE